MAQHKSNYKIPLFWLSETNEKGEPFVQIGITLLQNKVFQTLPPTAQNVYICMTAEAKGNKEFSFPLSVAERYGFKSSTFRNAVKTLVKKGFIEYTSGKSTRTPNEYKFVQLWKTPP